MNPFSALTICLLSHYHLSSQHRLLHFLWLGSRIDVSFEKEQSKEVALVDVLEMHFHPYQYSIVIRH